MNKSNCNLPPTGKRKLLRFQKQLQKIYPDHKDEIEVRQIKRGEWAIFIPNCLFIQDTWGNSGIANPMRLKRPEEITNE